MKSVAQKIFISLGFITLIALSVTPVIVDAQTPPTNTFQNTLNTGLGLLTSFWTAPLKIVFYILMTFTAAILGMSGLFLDLVLNLTVVKLSSTINNLSSINTTWRIIRDLANMSFIFILLYEGIRMVLGLGGAGIKKVVSGIVMAAILINFSLFFTKVIIDASNIVALGFYKSIVSSGTTTVAGVEINFGLSGSFMKVLRLSSLYTGSAVNIFGGGVAGFFSITGATIFMLIAAFIFLAIAVLFIVRYLSFILLLIMSPIYFASMAIPGLETLKKKYSQTLISQALFAPVFMLLTWVMLTVATDPEFIKIPTDKTLMDALTAPTSDTISLIINYVFIIGLLIQTLILSKSVASSGGIISSKLIDKGTGYFGGAVFGGAARAGTQTIGRLGRAIADNDSLRERVEKGGVTGKFAKWTLQGAKSTADASFDFRNASGLSDQLSKAGAGKGIKGGYDSYLKEKKKEDKELLELIKPSDRAVAQAEETLKSDAFKEQERLKKDAYFASPERIKEVADERAKRQKVLSNAIKERTKAETDFTAAQTELALITNRIEQSTTYTDLQNQLAAATDDAAREAIQTQISELRKPIDEIKAKSDTFNNLAKQKKAAFDKATNDLVDGLEKWQAAGYESWISKEEKDLIATKGGQDEKKYTKKDGELAGQIKTREVLPQSDIRAKAIAERLSNKKSFWMPWMYATGDVPEFNKDRARAVKKGLKKKKSVEEELKAIAKEEADNSDDGAPAAAPATPPITPPTP